MFKPSSERIPYKIEITEVQDYNKDGATDILDIEYLLKNHKNTLTILKGDGDFRSKESIELLKEADIIVTNPPFSLFREYMQQLIEYEKDFLILGNPNSITYIDIFPLITQEKLWLGNPVPRGSLWFNIPERAISTISKRDPTCFRYENESAQARRPSAWFTNLDHNKRHEELILYKNYSPQEYPKYDNYKAVEVGMVELIPYDYDGIMGVPISFLNKYNPNQFEIIGADFQVKQGLLDFLIEEDWNGKLDRGYLNGKRKYARLFIKNKKVESKNES